MMKRKMFSKASVLAMSIFVCGSSFAGNPDRAGQSGASELLINPWTRSSGWGGANSATVKGIESMFLNIAGSAFTKKTELVFARTQWLKGTGINVNAFGFTQKVGESGVMGVGVMSMDFGDIQITTVDQPEGGIGTFSPQYMNINLSYAKSFSNSIYGGANIKVISESISDVSAQGIAFDAGIQYVTGKTENMKFGISLRNVGPPMKFTGDGFSFRGTIPSTGANLTVEHRSAKFELPTLVNIGGAYDIKFMEMHRVTIAANFTSNSFTQDQFMGGLEYGFKNYFMLRGGYVYEKNISDAVLRVNSLTGLCAGFTVEMPFGKEKSKSFGLDYSYRASNPFDGVHTIGARIAL